MADCKNEELSPTGKVHVTMTRFTSEGKFLFVKKHKDLYFVPNFLVSFGILFAAYVGMFSRLIPKFWKMFLDLGVVALWALLFLSYDNFVTVSGDVVAEHAHGILDPSLFEDWWLVGLIAIVNMAFLVFRGEYTESSLKGEKFIRYLVPINLFASGTYAAFRIFTQQPIAPLNVLPYDEPVGICGHWGLSVSISTCFRAIITSSDLLIARPT